jgi:3-hydroxy-9,10-secoandrosta-1,3,5(10)-triene-9,17-dione monooxygenase reductase component
MSAHDTRVRTGEARGQGRADAFPPVAATVSGDRFRRVLGHLPTGVAVVTASGRDGPVGMAVNAVTSVSLVPPLILICPANASQTWPQIRACDHFCVNITAGHHQEICRRFALRGVDRFEGISYHARSGGPALDDAAAWIDCSIRDEHAAGDHTIVVADVLDLEAAEDPSPLVFFRGRYGTFIAGPASID